jgi:hypothetical protein
MKPSIFKFYVTPVKTGTPYATLVYHTSRYKNSDWYLDRLKTTRLVDYFIIEGIHDPNHVNTTKEKTVEELLIVNPKFTPSEELLATLNPIKVRNLSNEPS